MAYYKDEMFRDLQKLCRILSANEEDNNIITAREIIEMEITILEVEEADGITEETTYPYRMKDLISDHTSKWFSDRTTDRVSIVCKTCETSIRDKYPDALCRIQETRSSIAQNFKPFKAELPRRSSKNKDRNTTTTVSYTHLTLPTTSRV